MRFAVIAAATVALSLVACNGSQGFDSGTVESTRVETPESTEPSPTATPLTPESSENTLIETPEYTGVIFSKSGAQQFGFVFGGATPTFWEPSTDDVAKAEECIRQFLASAQDNPELRSYEKANAAFVLENLESYRRQYVGIVVGGEKRIWCNCFSDVYEFPEWQSAPVYVLDGGRYFWDIEYVLDKDECINFKVHGEA